MHNYNSINKNNTLIILDWDNTLFPTTWLVKNNINLRDANMIKKNIIYFRKLDIILHNLLEKLSKYGKIIIVTNALPMWIKISSQVLPKTIKFLTQIKIISARKNYQAYAPNIMDWKKMAFRDEVTKEMLDKNILNIISIGDAEYEYRALIDLYNLINKKKILKSIRLVDDPSRETLIDQLEVITKSVHNICTSTKHMDKKFKFY